MKDPFAVLDLPHDPDLTDGHVHDAYRTKLAAAHPDHGGDPTHPTDVADITAAYTALRSGVRRADALTHHTHDTTSTARDLPDTVAGPPPSPQRREQLRRKVTAARREQGLPDRITDPATIDKIADLLHYSRKDPPPERAGPPPPAAAPPAPADIAAPAGTPHPHAGTPATKLRGIVLRIRHGRPHYLTARTLTAAAVPTLAYLTAPHHPSWLALTTGAATWLTLTARYDLAPPHPDTR